MPKENMPITNGFARVTRAQALKQNDQKRLIGTRSKRNALEDDDNNNNNKACEPALAQNKRRVVLKDVTNNVLCANSFKSCLNASKLPKNTTNQKQIKKCTSKLSKVAPSETEKVGQLPTDSKEKGVQGIANTELNSSKNEISEKEENSIVFTKVAEESLQIELGKQIVELPSKALVFPMRGLQNLFAGFVLWKQLLWKQGQAVYIRPSKNPQCGKIYALGKKVEKVGLFENLLMPKNPNVTDIDSDLKDPLLCSFYAPDIYVHLRVAERIRRPTSDFIETVQRDITQGMRGILVDWLVEVSVEYKLVPDTLYLTVHLIDLYLSQNYIERQKLQLLGITCMLIASKYEEICAPHVGELCFITDNTYTKEEVLALERKVLNYLGFRLSVPTAKTFLRRYLRVAQASYRGSSLELEFLANYLAELTFVDYDMLKFIPSIIAASAVFLARWTLNQSSHPWNDTLVFYTNYKASDLKATVLKIRSLQLNTAGCPLNAIRVKYRQDKFKAVADLYSPELRETLF